MSKVSLSQFNLFSLHPVVLYAVSGVYFAGVMVRLMLTLTPIVCVLAAISVSHIMDTFLKPVPSSSPSGNEGTGVHHVHVHVLV